MDRLATFVDEKNDRWNQIAHNVGLHVVADCTYLFISTKHPHSPPL